MNARAGAGARASAGALPDTAALVGQVAAAADRTAVRAAGVADQLRTGVHALLLTLGGGPPGQLAAAQASASAAEEALAEASSALTDVATALRAFTGRTT